MPPGCLMHFLWAIRAERTYKPRIPQNDSCSESHHNLLLLLLLFHIDKTVKYSRSQLCNPCKFSECQELNIFGKVPIEPTIVCLS